MKKYYLILIMFVILSSCTNDDSIVMYRNIATHFSLYDTSGDETTKFKSGNDIEMRFSLTNMSGEDLSYSYTGSPVIFEIHQVDTVIATSMDGIGFRLIVLQDEIKNGETFRSNWFVENTAQRDSTLELPVGEYEAYVSHIPFFNEYKIQKTEKIVFTIIDE